DFSYLVVFSSRRRPTCCLSDWSSDVCTSGLILFNVISAVAAVPEQLKDAATVFRLPRRARWRSLYLPAAFPALVTGWVTAAGGEIGRASCRERVSTCAKVNRGARKLAK